MSGHRLDEALARLDRARVPADLFGDDEAEAARRYRRLARLVHPDATGGRTRDAFIRLNDLWRGYRGGDPATITTRRHAYRLEGGAIGGDLAELYRARVGPGRDVLLKMPRDPRDGDLVEREAVALRQLPKDGDGKFLPYVPRLVESFRHRDAATGAQRQVNVIAALDGFHSLAEVGRAYPDGVDPRDAAWMWRRLLVGLGFAHRAGVLHGAVLPDHVLIHPEEHGLVLVDWCYSVPGCYAHTDPSGRVPAMVDRYAGLVPARGAGTADGEPGDRHLHGHPVHHRPDGRQGAQGDALVRAGLHAPRAEPAPRGRLAAARRAGRAAGAALRPAPLPPLPPARSR